ncbi:hypothetical protein CKR_1608 [Clostridium kluyveri NBRC 12016]|uniref:Carrier domain-containing protein n=1 Tax=Clostridium kluyveri (strain NBRC 12016) TaxID=583346 RepID=B9E2D4_CLOK1|nr:hypothetical protein CKR_1608 [Clostridium kluyveri NBRC 12016]
MILFTKIHKINNYMRGKKVNNLVDMFINISNNEDKSITFIDDDNKEEIISFRNLYIMAHHLLYQLQKMGISQNDELIFQIQDNKKCIMFFWACILGRIIPVHVTSGNNHEQKLNLFRIWKQLNNPYLITDRDTLLNLENYAVMHECLENINDIKKRTFTLEEISVDGHDGVIKKSKANDIAFIQFSSGSTGEPKGAPITHANVIANIDDIIERTQITSKDSFFSWMPLNHNMGMIGFHVLPLRANLNHCIMSTDLFLQKPVQWIDEVNKRRSTYIVSPNFGYRYFLSHFKRSKAIKWELSCVRLILNGAEPIDASLIQEFMDALAVYGLRRTSMYPAYGMTEATLGISYPPINEDMKVLSIDRNQIITGKHVNFINTEMSIMKAISFVDVGSPLSNCSVQIVDNGRSVLGENTIGNIYIKGKNVIKGYYNNQGATSEAINEEGWLNTGDLGFMHNGRLVITGRAKDIVFINGCNYYPHDIERIVEQVDGVGSGRVAACGIYNKEMHREEVIIFVLTDVNLEKFTLLTFKIKQHVMKCMGLNIKDVLPVREFPRTDSGKIQRYKIAEIYKLGKFEGVSRRMNMLSEEFTNNRKIKCADTVVERTVLSICKSILGKSKIDIHDNLIEMGMDSILIAKTCKELNGCFQRKVSVAQIFAHPTVSELSQYISNVSKKDEKQEKRIDKLFEGLDKGDYTVNEIIDILDQR